MDGIITTDVAREALETHWLANFIPRVRNTEITDLHAPPDILHFKGLRVFATARNAESISDLSDLGIEVMNLEVQNVQNIREVKQMVQQKASGGLDYLVNNAGQNYTVPGVEMDIDEVRDLFETNVFAVMRICQEFTPLLIEARGTIIQIGSIAGVM